MKKFVKTARFVEVVHELRKKCPWDKKQTHKSLIPHLLEETYEVIDAIEGGNPAAFCEELGDLLLQIVLHSEIASEKDRFDFEKVAEKITDKMIRRHPHVFANASYKDMKTHLKNWTRLKAEEKPEKSLLEGIPRSLPSLQLAQRYNGIAASVGFDWPGPREAFTKVEEELGELQAELKGKIDRKAVELELGDLLFALTSLARHLDLDADAALKKSAAKFRFRFEGIEKKIRKKGKHLTDCDFEELEAAYQETKKQKR